MLAKPRGAVATVWLAAYITSPFSLHHLFSLHQRPPAQLQGTEPEPVALPRQRQRDQRGRGAVDQAAAHTLQDAGGWANRDTAERFAPDVILLDINLPTVNGLQATRSRNSCRRAQGKAGGLPPLQSHQNQSAIN